MSDIVVAPASRTRAGVVRVLLWHRSGAAWNMVCWSEPEQNETCAKYPTSLSVLQRMRCGYLPGGQAAGHRSASPMRCCPPAASSRPGGARLHIGQGRGPWRVERVPGEKSAQRLVSQRLRRRSRCAVLGEFGLRSGRPHIRYCGGATAPAILARRALSQKRTPRVAQPGLPQPRKLCGTCRRWSARAIRNGGPALGYLHRGGCRTKVWPEICWARLV